MISKIPSIGNLSSVSCLLSPVFCLPPYPLSCPTYQPSAHLLCKTNPIPKGPESTQTLISQRVTPILRSAPREKTNPNKLADAPMAGQTNSQTRLWRANQTRRSVQGGPTSRREALYRPRNDRYYLRMSDRIEVTSDYKNCKYRSSH